jgi:EAL domain-containing protein (putative c-di-GMP-specific phosphodiesterase class I)
MRRRAFDEPDTIERAGHDTNVSGVHSASTRPAPYLEELGSASRLVGSIPIDELGADFQPIVNLHTGETRGYEVLPRCRREGLTDPTELFARATFEKTVGELGRAIRSIAIRECAAAALYIPVHPGELRDRFIVRPDDPICVHDAPIFLQLSQPSLSDLARLVIAELGSRSGVALVIDDLGAGPSTLQQLIELEPAAVKLDRELVSGIDRSVRKQTVVRSLVAMCEQLGAQVIAKGVDSQSELNAVLDCGVVYGQGYVLGEPSPLPTISAWPPAG